MYDLIKLSWLDINTEIGWSNSQDLEAARCQSVGWLLKETDDLYVIASTIGHDLEDIENNQRIAIPKGCVVIKEYLCTGEGCG